MKRLFKMSGGQIDLLFQKVFCEPWKSIFSDVIDFLFSLKITKKKKGPES